MLWLAACNSLPSASGPPLAGGRESLQAFLLSGRFSLRFEGRSYVGHLDWRHDGDGDELLLSSPFGQSVAEIVSDASGARLIGSDGSSRTAATADELLQSVLACPLPLSKLLGWLQGGDPNATAITLDALGRPLHLRHEDWRIDYEYDSADPRALPGRLFVERESGFSLRLRIDAWQALPTPEDAP